jgi:DNA-directed RNA polymerase subunit RPC12/RpoP
MSSTASPFYKCDACGRTFEYLGELERHTREEHNKYATNRCVTINLEYSRFQVKNYISYQPYYRSRLHILVSVIQFLIVWISLDLSDIK